jgi:hypothetical protein
MLIVIAVAAFACGREHDEGAGAAPAGSEATVPGVETAVAAVEPVRDTVDGFGAVTSAGEPAEVRDARAELAAAEARRQLAAQQARRLEALATGAVAPRREIDAARAEEAAAAAAAARARQVLGAFGAVAEGSPLADDEVWVLARILQRDVPLVEAGAGASMRADAVPEPVLAGRVDAPPAYVDPLTQLAPVRLRVRDPARALRPGMTGAVRIEVGAPRAAVVVPAAAVVRDGAQPFVFVEAAAGRFEAQPVRIGVTRDGRVEIADGVAAGARVATIGAASLLSATRLPAGGGQ